MTWASKARITAGIGIIAVVLGCLFLYNSLTSSDIIEVPLALEGSKNIVMTRQTLGADALVGKNTVVVRYNLHGMCLLDGPASALSLVAADGAEYSVSLARYGQNCLYGEQSVHIPIEDFAINQPLGNMRSVEMQFWYPTAYSIDIEQIQASQPLFQFVQEDVSDFLLSRLTSTRREQKKSRTPRPKTATSSVAKTPPPPPAPSGGSVATTTVVTSASTTPQVIATTTPWAIRSVSSMKETKDKICAQDDAPLIASWVSKAVEIGANYVAVETPYDDPLCGSSVAYTEAWVNAVHGRGLNVWHRHMPLAFEGIYNAPKDSSKNYINQISAYIKAHPTFFRAGDIFTPIPEPQNGGISGITYCPQDICMFTGAADFNAWLRDAITSSESAFVSIGLGGKIKIGYYGFDGFVAWGDNNPDWDGILEDATVRAMGNITIDHYPEIVGDTMAHDLDELQAKYPSTPIVIGEWGTITGGDTVAQVHESMGAALRKNVIGFNYWHLGMGGNEALIGDGPVNLPAFTAVQSFFRQQSH